MDKLGEYIPLIVFGIIFVVSFLRKNKKAKQEHANTTLPRNVMQNPGLPKKQPAYTPPSTTTQPTQQMPTREARFQQPAKVWSFDQEAVSSLESGGQNTYMNSVPSVLDTHNTENEEPTLDQDSDQDGILTNIDPKNFDELRKAVIYSEILQRKYS